VCQVVLLAVLPSFSDLKTSLAELFVLINRDWVSCVVSGGTDGTMEHIYEVFHTGFDDG
jgi:hypothetical protein